jgi:glycosyltransferase involved in cell wall biosynthesis
MTQPASAAHATLRHIAVIIPAREPEPVLGPLAQSLAEAGFGLVLVVDDGSSAAAAALFREASTAGARVLVHAVNLGKGRALKSAFNCILAEYPAITAVVTADADGQHTLADIVRVAAETAARGTPVLGSRAFAGQVPLRSRFGNTLTRYVFASVTGSMLRDTQSGLRGFPRNVLPSLITLEGERYEFEMNMLAFLCRAGRKPFEVPIETVYIGGNRSSHFNPIWDSMRIYFVLARFVLSSVIAAVLDFALFTVTFAMTRNLAASVVIGRISSLLNFTLNRRFVFRANGALGRALVQYYILAAAVALTSYAAITLLAHRWSWNVIAAKLVVDAVLSMVSFSVQRTFIFRQMIRSEAAEDSPG